MKDEGFEVIALHFYTGFNGVLARDIERGRSVKWTPGENVVRAAENLGIQLVPMDVSGEYLDIILKPRYGYGSAANPCIDCRIFLLTKGREVMEREDAVVVFTGEVLGQRPMSQYKNTLRLVEKRSGLEGRLLRPLSAKFLDPTIPEKEGIIDRSRLYDIQGRSRKRQKELTRKFGIDSYPSPGGGCVLTARQFGEKFNDLVAHAKGRKLTLTDLTSLLTGRHLRLDSGVKVIVGRTEVENNYLKEVLLPDYWLFEARDFKGPAVFALDEPGEDDFLVISAITARYGKGVKEKSVAVTAKKGDVEKEYEVKPAVQKETKRLLISRDE